MSFKLEKASKIIKPSEYSAVFKNGKITRGKYWQVVARNTNSSPKLGLAIAKKAHRLAVDRNKFKRIARETFRHNKDKLSHWEFVVMARGGDASNNDLFQDLEKTLDKATKV